MEDSWKMRLTQPKRKYSLERGEDLNSWKKKNKSRLAINLMAAEKE